MYPYPLVPRNQTTGHPDSSIRHLVTPYPHLPVSVAPIPEEVLHPKRPTRVEKGPHYDFHNKEENAKEENSQSEDIHSATSAVPILTSKSSSTIMTILSETLPRFPSVKSVDETRMTELPIFGSRISEKTKKSQARTEDQMSKKIQQERKFKHLTAIVAPLVGTFIFLTGLAIGVVILVWQLDWVVLQRLRWHVSNIKVCIAN
ncbi:MAG TPA: hypothetical protein VK145_02075 [Candidatus Nanoarchaeia archaeon]|nr:hypothetical protein [Candidatus Nanoarchaeia archaeon]